MTAIGRPRSLPATDRAVLELQFAGSTGRLLERTDMNRFMTRVDLVNKYCLPQFISLA